MHRRALIESEDARDAALDGVVRALREGALLELQHKHAAKGPRVVVCYEAFDALLALASHSQQRQRQQLLQQREGGMVDDQDEDGGPQGQQGRGQGREELTPRRSRYQRAGGKSPRSGNARSQRTPRERETPRMEMDQTERGDDGQGGEQDHAVGLDLEDDLEILRASVTEAVEVVQSEVRRRRGLKAAQSRVNQNNNAVPNDSGGLNMCLQPVGDDGKPLKGKDQPRPSFDRFSRKQPAPKRKDGRRGKPTNSSTGAVFVSRHCEYAPTFGEVQGLLQIAPSASSTGRGAAGGR